ncbi:MAG: hypothetical protein GC179_16375 [Anaerolineaceae bacterium]|nr:hypothetical protein [Anaerolineaceae bacterium]
MKIFDLLIPRHDENSFNSFPVEDTFYSDNVLVEATLLDLLHYFLYKTAAILVDLRTSIYFKNENTGVVIFRGVTEISFHDDFKKGVVMPLGDISLRKTGKGFEFSIEYTYTKIKIVAQDVEFYIGDAKNIGGVATSLDEGITSYLQTTPHWDTEFEILAASKWG